MTEPEISFVRLDVDCLAALLDEDLSRASICAGVELPAEFLDDTWLWQLRHDQIRKTPASAPWLVRAACREPDRAVVGHAGYHGPPDDAGMVEIGYTILPRFRRQGYGLASAQALVREAATSFDVSRVRASVAPDNAPSLAIVNRLGFELVGEQIDEVDGLELVFELAIR